MKKHETISLTLLLASISLYAQNDSIPNGGFESWDSATVYYEPKSWYTLNPLVDFGFDYTTILTTDAHSGKYAARLESKAGTFNDLPGLLSSGPVLDASGNPDFSKVKVKFTSKPLKLRYYYKAAPASGDSCGVVMILTKWNSTFSKTDTVAIAAKSYTSAVNTYTLEELSFNYLLPFTPDSAFYLFSSSRDGYNPVPGSVFIVDDVSLDFPTGLESPDAGNDLFSVYPNPATSLINLTNETNESLTIQLTDATGRIIDTVDVNEKEKRSMDVSLFAPGIYFLIAKDKKGIETYKKFLH